MRVLGIAASNLRATWRFVPRRTAASATHDSSEQIRGKTLLSDVRRVDRLPLDEVTKQNLFGMGITKLFNIQARAFDPIMRGRNFVGRSRTGTGKTVAYLLPMLARVQQEKMVTPHSVLILVPTPQLCKQVAGTILSLSVSANIALVHGGPTLASQEQMVRLGPTIVVSTPGRCARLLERGAIQARNVRMLVIDEADAMFGTEFKGRTERIIGTIAKDSLQTILLSASLPADVQAVLSRHLQNYDFVDLVNDAGPRSASTVGSVVHSLCKVPQARNSRIRILLHFLATKLDELGGQCIIFVDSASEANALLQHPVLDLKARAIHSDTPSQARDAALTSFANREFDVLIATDIVSRGVDFKNVSLVLQFHPPHDATQYVHRAGRTGRAGQRGTCITLYDGAEEKFVQRVRDSTKQKFTMEITPGSHDIHYGAVSRLLDELLSVQVEEFTPMLHEAERLLADKGSHVLAVAMAVLDGRHASLDRAAREVPSILSGRKGYVCLLAASPEDSNSISDGEIRKIILALLPRTADESAIGRIARTSEGWAIDVARHLSARLVDDLRAGRKTAPFEVSVALRLPRLARVQRRVRRAPWANSRKRAVLERKIAREKPVNRKARSVTRKPT